MANQRKTKKSYSRSSGYNRGYTKRRTTSRKKSTKRSSRSSVQTLRIVVEQPQAQSSIVSPTVKTPRKAQF